MHKTQTTNRLIDESSPYLLQHAHNPVDWYPWGDEAFRKAKEEEKPILLSCGYSACHWCHVMERESFEDPDIAELMNRHFINIKVDREERPDIDQIYQHAVQAITGQGGWPLTVFLDHEKRPFFGGTYFPPDQRFGRMAFPELLTAIYQKWAGERETILKAGAELVQFMDNLSVPGETDSEAKKDLPKEAAFQIMQSFDSVYGGFGRAPKFPGVSNMQLLLRVGILEKMPQAVEEVLFTLKKMAEGGIYDQLGGGFHRYSTDARWLVPHFEKMLYDNAQLLKVYCIGFQIQHEDFFKRVVLETGDYIRREMTSPEGGFYATQDADSEGVEGKFFGWSRDEIKEILSPDEFEVVCDYYGVTEQGNFEGKNILNSLESGPSEEALSSEKREILERARQKLFLVREKRVKPFRDEKIITSWNGLMIGGLAYAYQVFGQNEDYQSAKQAAEFIWNKLRLADGALARTFKDGQSRVKAFLDDYSFLAQGLLDLYETDFDEQWLARSIELTDASIVKFSDGKGRYFLSEHEDGALISRPLSGYDQAIPSGVSVHVENLLRLATLAGRKTYYDEAEKILTAYSAEMANEGWSHAGLLGSLELFHQRMKEIVFISEEPNIPELLEKTWGVFIPNRILARHWGKGHGATLLSRELLEGRTMVEGLPTCYVCEDLRCLPPVTGWEQLRAIIS